MELLNYINSNPNWEEELSSAPYNLHITRDEGYIMFKYDQISSDFSISLVREARGIIFYEPTWKCVCHAFDKFGNYGESYCPEINWYSASVQEKVDGSLIKIWFHNGWHISTNGTINAFKAELPNNLKYKTFGELVLKAIKKDSDEHDFFERLSPSCTYIFELVSPYNRVVIPYEEIALYFLGWRDNLEGYELLPECCFLSNEFNTPKRYSLVGLKEVQDAAAALPWDEEGYVVCDNNFNRVKIKSPKYVMAHYARNNNVINEERLIEVLLKGEKDEFLTYANDYTDNIEEIERLMGEVANSSVKEMQNLFGGRNFESRADYAKEVNQYPVYMRDFLYSCYNERIFYAYASDWTAARWLKAINELKESK